MVTGYGHFSGWIHGTSYLDLRWPRGRCELCLLPGHRYPDCRWYAKVTLTTTTTLNDALASVEIPPPGGKESCHCSHGRCSHAIFGCCHTLCRWTTSPEERNPGSVFCSCSRSSCWYWGSRVAAALLVSSTRTPLRSLEPTTSGTFDADNDGLAHRHSIKINLLMPGFPPRKARQNNKHDIFLGSSRIILAEAHGHAVRSTRSLALGLLVAITATAGAQYSTPTAKRTTVPSPYSRVDLYGGYAFLQPSGSVEGFNYQRITDGAVTSASIYFKKRVGVQVEAGFHPYGYAPLDDPYLVAGHDCVNTVQGGPIFRFPKGISRPSSTCWLALLKLAAHVFNPAPGVSESRPAADWTMSLGSGINISPCDCSSLTTNT